MNSEVKSITLQKFYKVSNAVINGIHLFYIEKINNILSTNGNPYDSNEDNTICPICEEKVITTMLDCYVNILIKIFLFLKSIFFVKIALILGCLRKRIIVRYVELK